MQQPNSRERIVGTITSLDDLLEIHRDPEFAFGPPPAPTVTADVPLTGNIPVEWLRNVVQLQIESIEANRGQLVTTPDMDRYIDATLAQRRAFLAWLDTQAQEAIFISLYPEDVFQPIPSSRKPSKRKRK